MWLDGIVLADKLTGAIGVLLGPPSYTEFVQIPIFLSIICLPRVIFPTFGSARAEFTIGVTCSLRVEALTVRSGKGAHLIRCDGSGDGPGAIRQKSLPTL